MAKGTKQKVILWLWLFLYASIGITGGIGVPVLLIWPLFFDGPWYPFFISLFALVVELLLIDPCFKSIQPPIPKISLLMAEQPSNTISWMWGMALINTFFFFGKALFYDGSWWTFLGALCLSAFLKAVSRSALRQDRLLQGQILTEFEGESTDSNQEPTDPKVEPK